MTKGKKIALWISLIFIAVLLFAYLLIGHLYDKPGIDGFSVLHGVIRLHITGEDYVKVGENQYLFRDGKLEKLLETEYSSYFYTEYVLNYNKPLSEADLFKTCLVKKDEQILKPKGVNVGKLIRGAHSACFVPYEGKIISDY